MIDFLALLMIALDASLLALLFICTPACYASASASATTTTSTTTATATATTSTSTRQDAGATSSVVCQLLNSLLATVSGSAVESLPCPDINNTSPIQSPIDDKALLDNNHSPENISYHPDPQSLDGILDVDDNQSDSVPSLDRSTTISRSFSFSESGYPLTPPRSLGRQRKAAAVVVISDACDDEEAGRYHAGDVFKSGLVIGMSRLRSTGERIVERAKSLP
ncbi:MAG: hypothetical protein SGCHY_005123, partial [Lobulomycetales sp.]